MPCQRIQSLSSGQKDLLKNAKQAKDKSKYVFYTDKLAKEGQGQEGAEMKTRKMIIAIFQVEKSRGSEQQLTF